MILRDSATDNQRRQLIPHAHDHSWIYKRERLPLPPGPPADPLIGHLRRIPLENQEETFYKWGKVYGDVMHLRFPGRSIIVLNSGQAAVDLLEKRSSNYSDRPTFVVFELMGWVPTVTFLRYGQHFRKHRKILQDFFKPSMVPSYQQIQTQEAHTLVANLLENEGKHDDYLRRFATSIVIRIAYGHRIMSDDDPYLRLAESNGEAVSNSGPPGNSPVDLFPFLRHFPSWFPGAYYAAHARKWRPVIRELHEYPYGEIQQKIADGTANPSVLTSLLEKFNHEAPNPSDSLDDIQGIGGVIYAAGAETTWSSMAIFLLAMVIHPDCQLKAQEELDAVVGSDRLPEFSDRDSLPYVECILQESLRWHPALPMGIPHRTVKDDIYKGMFIPEGSLVIANARGMALDESVYTNPFDFRPTRFLPKPAGNGEPYFDAAFGFGRRICPGRHLAEASLWVAIASILATLTVSKAIGKDGKEITPDATFSSGLTSHPPPYLCSIRPRTEKARSLITQANFLSS